MSLIDDKEASKLDYRKMIDEIVEIASELCNEWEIDFIEDMGNWKGEFTSKQKETIEKLYQRACESDL